MMRRVRWQLCAQSRRFVLIHPAARISSDARPPETARADCPRQFHPVSQRHGSGRKKPARCMRPGTCSRAQSAVACAPPTGTRSTSSRQRSCSQSSQTRMFKASLFVPSPSRRRRIGAAAGVLAAALLLGGCTRAPAIALFGAVFPGWFFCLAGGVVATVIVHAACKATVGVEWLRPLPLSYTGLFAIFSALIWLAFFYR